MKHQQDETFRVVIERIVPNGFGIGFKEGTTFFVALAAPGDELDVKITQRKGKIAFAEIARIIKPSKERTTPRCPYFGACGGCNFQQLNYAAQLKAKVAIVRDCLSRIGKINYDREIEILGSPNDYEYRARAQWHVDAQRRKFGYFKRNSHDIIDVEVCPILTVEMQAILTEARETIEWESFSPEIFEIEAASGEEMSSIYSREILEPTTEISFAASGETYFYDADTFFQGNPFLIEALIDTALQEARGETAIDLYCGVGLFTLPLARRFERVFGVEGNEKAVKFAEKNVENARLENVELFTESVGDWLSQSAFENLDFCLLDPPRAGVEAETIENLLRLRPKQIAYVSCEPSTLARDLRALLATDVYRIESIVAVDLFPQTHHVETVVRLARN